MSVLLIGPGDDPQIRAVARALESRGVDGDRWDVDRWPGDASIAMTNSESHTDITIGDRPVSPADYRAVYLRKLGFDPRLPEYEAALEERPLAVCNQLREYRGLVRSTIDHLQERGVPVVNPPAAQGIHARKPWQLATLADAGIPVPESLSTNDPDAVRAFADRVGAVIYKPIAGGGHARALEPADLTDDRLSRLANSPVQFQARATGDDVRVFVVGGEVVAAARIVSDALDYRSESHDVDRIPPADLDPAIEAAAIRAAGRLGLAFAGVDVIADEDGFVILEANPSPMFATFDDLAGTSVAEALAAHLAEG